MFGLRKLTSKLNRQRVDRRNDVADSLGNRRKPLGVRSVGMEFLEDRCVPASTAQFLSDLSPGLQSSHPHDMVTLGSKTILATYEPSGLVVTDGTRAGTTRIEPPGRTFTNISDLRPMGSYVYFAAKDVMPNGQSEYGIELWRTDGTTVGTTLVKDIQTGTADSTPDSLTAVGNKLYFSVTNPMDNQDNSLWVSDGTAAGTHLVKDINPGSGDRIYIPYMQGWDNSLGNLLFFRAATNNMISSYQIYRTDGTGAGTFAVTSDPDGHIYPKLTAFNGKMYWDGDGKINYTNGTVAGTGSYSASVGYTSSLTVVGNKLAYLAYPIANGGNYTIWTTSGGSAGSQTVVLGNDYRWYDVNIWPVGSKVLLARGGGSASQAHYGADLYSCNLTNGTYSLLKTIEVASKETSFQNEKYVAGSTVYFQVYSKDQFFDSPYMWWQSDGTAATTAEVVNGFDGMPMSTGNYGQFSTLSSGDIVLTGRSTGIGEELFKIGSPTGASAAPNRTDIVGRYNEAGQWYVGISDGSKFNTAYWGTWSPGVAWVDVQSGDFDGDGKMDIVGRYGAAGQWYVGLSNGSSYSTSLWATWSPGVTWADVKVGDFNRDGRADIVGRWKEGGQWYVGLSTGTSFATSFWAYWSPGITWADVSVGDFNGDGRDDIVGRWQEGGQWYAGLSNDKTFATSYFGTWSPGVSWLDVKVADLNGDHRSDIVGRLAATGEWYGGLSNGTAFNTTLWGVWSVINWVDVSVGDFDGDGKADVAGRWKETGQWYVGKSNGSSFATSYFGAWSAAATWVDVKIGDFNGDGKMDLVGRHKEAGQWYVARSTGAAFANELWATWSAGATWSDCQTG